LFSVKVFRLFTQLCCGSVQQLPLQMGTFIYCLEITGTQKQSEFSNEKQENQNIE